MRINAFVPLFITERLDETRAFYTDHMGFTITIDAPGYMELRNGAATVAFMVPAPEDAATRPGDAQGLFWSLEVEDVDSEWARLTSTGAAAIKPPEDMPWGRGCVVADPNGIGLYLTKPDPSFDPASLQAGADQK